MANLAELKRAFHRDDAAAVRAAFAQNPEFKKLINEPIGPFDSPPILGAQSKAMLDALLEAGADINGRSRWWAGSFGFLDSASDELAAYAISRGARLDAHSAARLGMLDKLKELVAAQPELVHARGGDGKMPLHFARNVEVAAFLLEKGADIDSRDIDHESTAAQHLIGERTEVVRFLVERGCATDVFLAAALGDLPLLEKHLRANPDGARMRVDAGSFPMKNAQAGGTIYQWTLGFNVSPHQVARKFGQEAALQLLMERSPAEVQLVNWCWLGETARAKEIVARDTGVSKKISGADARAMADAARDNHLNVARCMVEAGLPVDSRGQHGGTPLHWSAWNGNVEMTELLLHNGAAALLEVKDRDHDGTPLGWAIYGSEHGWCVENGDYAGVVKALLAAGASRPEKSEGSAAVRAALRG